MALTSNCGVSDAGTFGSALQEDRPHQFAPRTVEGLFDAIKRVVEPRMDRLYLRLPLPDGGLAVEATELGRLPGSLAEILVRTAPIDTNTYRRSLTADVTTKYVLAGSASAKFTVRRQPPRTH